MRSPFLLVLFSLNLAFPVACRTSDTASPGGESPPEETATPPADTAEEPRDADEDGWIEGEDCDDTDAAVNPGATETCNGVDDDCDGDIDEGVTESWWVDADGDGYGDPEGATDACDAPTGFVAASDDEDVDCDDTDASVHPGASETCDGGDDDCDGDIDEGVTETYYLDADGDGYGDADSTVQACEPPSGYVSEPVDGEYDCDDADDTAWPGAPEACDGADDDCDGEVDEGVMETFYADTDGDGYGDAFDTVQACEAPAGYVDAPADGEYDCDDAASDTCPGCAERCDGVDNDCDGDIDEDLTEVWYLDADGDGYGDSDTSLETCAPPSQYVAGEEAGMPFDCDDTDADLNPADDDGDGSSTCDGDCDDGDAAVHPGTKETCNGVDDDCDGDVDEGVTTTYYRDADGDGYGDADTTTEDCSVPSGYVAAPSDGGYDCDDSDATAHPGATEICGDGIDNDCDGEVDEGEGDTGSSDTGDTGGGDTADTGSGDTGDTGGTVTCPSDMVPVGGAFCIDIYEASRPDATASDEGTDDSMALSVAGVVPWSVSDNTTAEEACEAAGKRLCTEDEWYEACIGPDETTYAYGDDYEAETCNGIDTHCTCADGSVYEDCYFDCGGSFYLLPTGDLSDCTNDYGVYDMNGNLWEHISAGDGTTVRGGAYNCGDTPAFHACDYVPTTWTPSALGFRCCSDGE